MQLHVSVMFNMHKKWSGSVVYAATETRENGNTGYPSCFQNGLTCFCHVSVYGFLQSRPVHACSFSKWIELRLVNRRGVTRVICPKRDQNY